MGREATRLLAALVAGLVSTAGCGARTGIETPGVERIAADDGRPQGVDGGGASSGPVLCSELAGPAASCMPTPQSGPVVACNTDFPDCVVLPGASFWTCCNGHPHYDGPGGNCGGYSPCALVQEEVAVGITTPPGEATHLCLSGPLPEPGGVVPNCAVLAARLPTGTASPAEVADCSRCDVPGLAPPPAGTFVTSISRDLTNYTCVCRVDAVATCSAGAATPVAVSWCYDPIGGPSCPGASLAFSAPAGFVSRGIARVLRAGRLRS